MEVKVIDLVEIHGKVKLLVRRFFQGLRGFNWLRISSNEVRDLEKFVTCSFVPRVEFLPKLMKRKYSLEKNSRFSLCSFVFN